MSARRQVIQVSLDNYIGRMLCHEYGHDPEHHHDRNPVPDAAFDEALQITDSLDFHFASYW
jgi:hypothetical protein